MSRIVLTGGAYEARSLIASAQRCINLWQEPMPAEQGEPAPMAHYPAPGLRLLNQMPQRPIRGIRTTTSGVVYVVAGSGVYVLDAKWNATLVGSITAGLTTPVSMADNGLTLVVVDGTMNGWTVTLAGNAFAQLPKVTLQHQAGGATMVTNGTGYSVGDKLLADGGTPVQGQSAVEFTVTTIDAAGGVTGLTTSAPCTYSTKPDDPTPLTYAGLGTGATVHLTYNELSFESPFVGADRVDYLDTYFIFNKPGTPQFIWSGSLATTFDPLDFINKESYSDLLVAAVVADRKIWLIGTFTTEIFYNTGQSGGIADVTFGAAPGVFVDRGCVAKYSAATLDNAVYWLGQDRAGQGLILKGAGYAVERISTYAIETELTTYPRIDDAIGMTYMSGGHAFYVIAFPHADKTWAYDTGTKLWHEWVWIDANGTEHRHRANCMFNANGTVLCGDHENGNLYAVDQNVYTDNGGPIKRLRHYIHLLNDGKRVFYRQFLADIEAGTGDNTLLGDGGPLLRETGAVYLREDGTVLEREDVLTEGDSTVSLAWSDSRGASFGNPVMQSFGQAGEYRTSVQYQRLGLARDRIFQIQWSSATRTALLGAFIDATPAET